ncbi:MAG: isocitrate lyase/PEP mutase family protein [Novosphingobium sp.]|nr:isocitrate lyase/PEP mutase family protein [Novosphingobium sp.]
MSARKFRELLAQPGEIVIPEASFPGFARLVESMGFPAIYCGGYSLGAINYAVPDHGLVSPSEMVESARRIADVVDIPVICDADQGGESLLNVYRTVQTFERAGIAAIHLEDSRNPKHMYRNDALVSTGEMTDRIKAAVDARRDADFCVIGRTDTMFNGGTVDEVIERGLAYAEAGADMYFVCLLPPDQIQYVADNVPLPLMDIGHPGARGDTQVGLKLKVWAGLLIRGMMMAGWEMLKKLQEEGYVEMVGGDEYGRIPPHKPGFMDVALHDRDYIALMEKFAAAKG